MSQESFEKFRQLVLQDASLQQRLKCTPDRAAFIALTVRLGEESGCRFDAEDVEEALRAARRTWVRRWMSG